MKAIHSVQTKIEGDNITITGKLIDIKFPDVVSQRHTIGHFVSTNPHRPRMCRATNHGFMVERHGADGFLWPMDEMVAIALQVDPKLSDAPLLGRHPTAEDMVLECKSETEARAQWQESDDGANWTNLDAVVDASFKPVPGKHYRCELTNQSGTTTTQPFQVKKPEAK